MNIKNMTSYALVLTIINIFTTTLKAYYYQASHWAKENKQLILIRDRHKIPAKKQQQYLEAVHTQRKDLLDFLDATESLIIVEDLDVYTLELTDKLDTFLEDPLAYTPNNNLGFSLEDLLPKLKTVVTPLIGFTQCCHASNIKVVDVDFRFFFLDSLKDDLTTKHAFELCKKAISEIESYKDSSELMEIYRKQLANINPLFSSYKTFYNHIINKSMPTDKINKLIDLKILHHIYVNNSYEVIVVLAGGAHISRIEKLLPTLGFEKQSSTYKITAAEKPLNLKTYLRPFLA